jgi:two-component system NtrC family sensor kinase
MTIRLADAQKQIYQSEKLASVGKLAAGVAHEINNPLTGVLTYSSFLHKRLEKGDITVTPDDGQVIDDLGVIVHETKRCRDIVKGLLDFSRQAPAQKGPVSINVVIEQTLGILHNQLQINHVQIIQELDPNLPEIHADMNQMEQIFINIIVNASDAIGKQGGEIRIKTETDDDGETVQITVTDSGCGISEEARSKIFDPFYSTKGRKGTGLGLAVVWGIVEEHKGNITVDSEVGRGTVFKLRFPVQKASTALIRE